MSDKILTISIAAYNVRDFISNTLESLLIDNIEDLEILVNNDGGNDDTIAIAERYAEKYPHIIKIVKKENGGYGSTINYGIDHATGKYFKQLDGDDWFDKDGLNSLLELLRKNDADVFYTPYIYYDLRKQSSEKRDTFCDVLEGLYEINKVINRHHVFWMNMYTITYRTQLLKDCHVRLIEKCLYTDTIYALIPVTYAHSIYISHDYVYVYRVGREEQSVSARSKMKHFNDHMMVSLFIAEFYSRNKYVFTPEIKEYYEYYASGMLAITAIEFLFPKKNGRTYLSEYFNKIKTIDEELYLMMIKSGRVLKLYNFLGNKCFAVFHLYCKWKWR